MKPLQALFALFLFALLPLHAASLDDLTYTTADGKVTITDCDEAATGELVIPQTVPPAFSNIKQFFVMAVPVFIVICFLAAILDWLGLLSWSSKVLAPALALFNLPSLVAIP